MPWDVDAWREERDRERAAEETARRKQLRLREIIIVGVALILLILLLVPVFRKRSDRDLSMMSAQNLMQWGIALNLYLIENANTLPEVGPDTVSEDFEKAWYNALPPYLSQEPLSTRSRLEIDPETTSLWVDPAVDPKDIPRYQDFVLTYAMNRCLQPSPEDGAYRIFDLQNPGAVIFLTEVLQSNPGATPEDVRFRHGTRSEPKAHVLFCDGHVELLDRKVLTENPDAIEPKEQLATVSWVPFVGAADY